MTNTLLANSDKLRPPPFCRQSGLQPGEYFAMTLDGPANVDEPKGLAALQQAFNAAVRGLPVVLPMHPRTAKTFATLPSMPAGGSSTHSAIRSSTTWCARNVACSPTPAASSRKPR